MNASFEPPASQVDSAPGTTPPQSSLGIASLVLAILAIVIMTAAFGYIGYVELNTVGGVEADKGVAVIFGLILFGCFALLVLSAILGVISVFQKNRKHVLGAVGASLSTTMIVLVALLMWFGATHG